jgi:hypothetical protein
VYALTPRSFTGFIQRTIFRYPAPMQMTTLPARLVRREVERCGARLVTSDPRSGVGQHWWMTCHFIASDAPLADSDLVALR